MTMRAGSCRSRTCPENAAFLVVGVHRVMAGVMFHRVHAVAPSVEIDCWPVHWSHCMMTPTDDHGGRVRGIPVMSAISDSRSCRGRLAATLEFLKRTRWEMRSLRFACAAIICRFMTNHDIRSAASVILMRHRRSCKRSTRRSTRSRFTIRLTRITRNTTPAAAIAGRRIA